MDFGLPGFTANMVFQNIERRYYHSSLESVGYSHSIIPSFNGCPGCETICKPCYKCLHSTSNPHNCSFVCNDCWSCDCTAPPDI
jgi:hypothetical protein